MLCACFRFVCAYCGATKLHELDKRTDSLNTYVLTSFANILTCMGDFCSAVQNSKWQQVGKALAWHISGFVLVDSEDAVTFELILSYNKFDVDAGPTKGSQQVFISSNSGWFCDMRAHSLNWLPPAPNPPLPTHPTTRSLSLSLLSPLQFSIMPHRFYTQSTFAMTRLWGNPIPPSCFQNLLSTGTHFLSLTLSHTHTPPSPQISQGTNYLHSECDPTHFAGCLTQVPFWRAAMWFLSLLPRRPLCLLRGILELNFKTMYGCCLRLSARAQVACKSDQDHTPHWRPTLKGKLNC